MEALHVRTRERALAVCRAAEPGISPAQGRISAQTPSGMKAGGLVIVATGLAAKSAANVATAQNAPIITVSSMTSLK